MRLYLDFDGVLHRFMASAGQEEAERLGHYRKCKDGERVYWHPTFFEHVPALAEALEPFPDVQIYVHSSWRFMWQEVRPDDLTDWLGPLAARFVRFVPRHIMTKRRLEVVQMDMAADKYVGPWVAVDDFVGEFEGCPDVHFVGTDSKRGLGQGFKLNELVRKVRAQMEVAP